MSWPSMSTLPPPIARPRLTRPSRASATVVLPEPDSPTRPSTCPGCTVNDTWSTTSASARRRDADITIRRFSTASRGVPGPAGGLAAGISSTVAVAVAGMSSDEAAMSGHLPRYQGDRLRFGGSPADPERGPRHRVGERVHADGEQRDEDGRHEHPP